MDIDSARLARYHAAANPVLREHAAETRKSSQVARVAKTVAAQAVIEFGHDTERTSRGAKALLLDVLA